MALGECAEGLIRLFFIFVKFSLDHLGWGITFLIALWFLFWVLSKFGVSFLPAAVAIIVIFLVFFFATAWYTGAPLCQFADEVSQLLV